jgi:hypothetical protein
VKNVNENNTCYAITYILNFKPFGGGAGIASIFKSIIFRPMIRLEKNKNSA